jgi:hypothetical protein
MKRLATILLLLAIGAAAGWYFASPWWTLHQIKAAADARDAKTLSSYVDYAAVREDVKAQIQPRVNPRSVDGPADIADILASTVAQGIADAVVRPEGLTAVFAAGSVAKSPFAMRSEDMQMRRDGLSQFRLVNSGTGGGELVFRRHGLGWKLAGVRVPEGGLKLKL